MFLIFPIHIYLYCVTASGNPTPLTFFANLQYLLWISQGYPITNIHLVCPGSSRAFGTLLLHLPLAIWTRQGGQAPVCIITQFHHMS